MTKIKTRESQNVEFKTSWHNKYLEWICGFAFQRGYDIVSGKRIHSGSGQTGGQTTMEIIFNMIKDNPSITRSELMKATGKASSYIQRCINTLKSENKIRRCGSPIFGGYWEIIAQDEDK